MAGVLFMKRKDDQLLKSGNFVTGTLDYVLIVDRNYRVLYNNRYDARMTKCDSPLSMAECETSFFEFYPTLKKSESSFVETMNTGKITERMNQRHVDREGKVYYTNNITIPIIRGGIIIGAVELVRDITTVDTIGMDDQEKADRSDQRLNPTFNFDDVLTQDPEMMEIKRMAELFATTSKPTLIYGETGTGKELLAQSIIVRSGVPADKVVIQNCAAVPVNLLETTLFGSFKGAFTGAERVVGLFELADGGILFLDELNSIPLSLQAKLLRVLQDGTFRPVGSEKEKRIQVKVIATVNIDPMKAIDEGILRSDLFYRFSGNLLSIPPLRERKGDILFYTDIFLKQACELYEKNDVSLSNELKDFFVEYTWPGNVREIKHLIESMVSLTSKKELTLKDLPAYLYHRVSGTTIPQETVLRDEPEKLESLGLTEYLEQVERECIKNALIKEDGMLGKAAERLHIPRQTLSYRIKKLGL